MNEAKEEASGVECRRCGCLDLRVVYTRRPRQRRAAQGSAESAGRE